MASLEFYDKHNMVAYLEKSEGSEWFHQIIDFLTASHIKNALTECPTIYASPIEQFWQTTALSTNEDGVRGITATIDRKVKVFVSEASIRIHLKLEDSKGLKTLPTAEIFKQLALIGVKKLEQTIKISQARRRAKVVIFDDEEAEEDPSNQGRSLIEELDLDDGISLVPPHVVDQGRIDDTQISDQPEEQLVSTASRLVSTADISTASELDSTAGVKAKDKGKAIMLEYEPPKKIKKKVQVQMSVDEELAKKVFEEEQARFNVEQEARFKAEQEQDRIDFETALELQKQLDEREEVAAKVDQAHEIDWSDPAILRYHTLKNLPFSVAEVRKNMCLYMKNQGSEIEREVMKRSGFDLQQESSKPIEEEIVQQDDVIAKQAVKESSRTAGGRRKKSLARKRARETLSEESAKKQKLEDDTEKEELQIYLNIVSEDESLDVESLATKQDVLELYRFVKERFKIASPEGYDLLLWGDLKTLIKPNEKDEIWRNQQDWNMIN
ncbi:hypothetical protein Tco_0882288 [Tanacetum coccineum]